MTEYLESFINIVYDIKSSWSGENITSLDLIKRVLSNNTLLKAVADRTSLSAEYINNTIISVVYSAGKIAEVYQALTENNDDTLVELLNTTNATATCEPSINPNDMILLSFIPALIIIFILSMVNTRVWKRKYCGGKPGLAIPVNLLDSFEDRFTYAFAFGATASRITGVILGSQYTLVFGSDFEEDNKSMPTWFSSIYKIGAAFLVGISYYPFFACITTYQRLLGAVLGTIYSLIWLSAYISQMVECGGKSQDGTLGDNLAFSAPPIICHGLLLLCFIRVLVRSLISKKRGMVITEDEWKENYKYHHVKKLLKSAPKSSQTVIVTGGFKQNITSKLYKWIPDFKYSTRIICIFLTAIISLYLVIVLYMIISRIISLLLNDLLDELSSTAELAGNTIVNWSRLKEAIKVTVVCWNVAIAVASIKSIIMMTNMISWYRGHVLRLQRGDRSFLPVTIDNQAPSDIMVASFKFAGYQVAYILWGFLIAQFIIFVIVSILALFLIWPLIWGTVNDSLILTVVLNIWPTIFISVLTIFVQRLMAKYIFLRDFGATLALNNRRLFHIASYFLFFLNIFVGIFSCLLRIFFAMLFGVLFLPRLQKSALPRDWELFDPGYKTYVGYLCLEHTHANPVLLTFSKLLLDAVTVKVGCCEDGIRMEGLKKILARRARNRWFVAITLINNPELKNLRRQEHLNTFTAISKLATDMFKITETVTVEDC